VATVTSRLWFMPVHDYGLAIYRLGIDWTFKLGIDKLST